MLFASNREAELACGSSGHVLEGICDLKGLSLVWLDRLKVTHLGKAGASTGLEPCSPRKRA